MEQSEEFEYAQAPDGLKRLMMPKEARVRWLAIMAALERASVAEWGEFGSLYWYCTRELYGSSEYKWRAYCRINLTEVTLEWPRS